MQTLMSAGEKKDDYNEDVGLSTALVPRLLSEVKNYEDFHKCVLSKSVQPG